MHNGADTSSPPLTVRGALELPELQRGVPKVLAAPERLDQEVRWVHTGEFRNMAAFIKGGELLLTTGMGLGNDADQRRFVIELAERELAALVVELGTRFQEIPKLLVAEAERHGLPLVALHRQVPFVEITEALHRRIINRHYVLMRRADELHSHFTSLIFEGAGIPEVLAALATEIRNPVLLERVGRGIVYHATYQAGTSEAIAAWDGVRQGIPSAPPVISVNVPATGNDGWGRLVALALDSELDDLDRVALERAVALISLGLLRTGQEESLAVRERGNFLNTLIAGDLSDSEATTRAADLGFERATTHLLPLAVRRRPASGVPLASDEAIAWALVWRDIDRELRALRIPMIAGSRPGHGDMLVVIGFDELDQRAGVAERAAKLIHRACARQLGSAEAVVVAAGAACGSWSATGHHLVDVIDTAAAGAAGPHQVLHDVTRADLHRLFWSMRDSRALQEFAERRLAPLVEHDMRRKSTLIPTLEAFCENGGRKAQTARALHLERQSLYHRLERIEALLEADLSDSDVLLGLQIALRARRQIGS